MTDRLSRAHQLLTSGQLDPERVRLLAGDLPRARECATRALAADPRNPVALQELGAILGQEGGSLRALYYLRRSTSAIPRTRRPRTASPSPLGRRNDSKQTHVLWALPTLPDCLFGKKATRRFLP